MKPSVFLFVAAIIIAGCAKSNPANNCDHYFINKLAEEGCVNDPTLTDQDNYIALVKGNYNGQTVYFKDVVCMACNAIAPQYGVNCNRDTVWFQNFQDVQEQKILVRCRQSFFPH